MDILNEVNDRFPVRNSDAQKKAFRAWAAEKARAAGLDAREENNGGHINLVIGDPEKAQVLFTAHYDTPRRSLFPNLMLPTKKVLRYVYSFAILLPMLAVSILGARLARNTAFPSLGEIPSRFVMLAVYAALFFGLYCLIMHGPANRANKNDNTSGTAAVLSLALRLPGETRAAWILFDDEEKGKKGSKAYAAAHPEIKAGKLVVNMDCVGNGTRFLAGIPVAARANPACPALEETLNALGALVLPSRKISMNSDQMSFDQGVGICACLPHRWVGWYVPSIHTSRDTVASGDTTEALAGALEGFVRKI